MCGITGILRPKGEGNIELLKKMNCLLAHRGPDAEGYYCDEKKGIALGHRRLSIIDLTTGQQPVHNEDRSIWVILNGEIYNFRELAKSLEEAGHTFYTRSDTEAIVHAYEEYGENSLKHLRGMFAFALWDSRKEILILARDRVGKKPLVYTRLSDGTLLFSSELQSLMAHPGVSREINFNSLHDYLTFQYIPSPSTIYKGVFKLPPAHYIKAKAGTIEINEYWEPSFSEEYNVSEDEACFKVKELLTDAVRIRMISDVPLGAFLSGGIDSSIVVGIMSEISKSPVKTFSIGFEEEKYSELKYARMVAERFQTEHHEFVVNPDAVEVLPSLVRHYGEPYADSSALPTFYLSQLTRQHVTVALNGDGGDELFAGYNRYKIGAVVLPSAIMKGISRMLDSLPLKESPRGLLGKMRRFAALSDSTPARRYGRIMSYFSPEERASLYTPWMHEQIGSADPYSYFERLFDRGAGLGPVNRALLVDLCSYLPEDLLVKVDIASMMNSLEARSPFLDHKLIDYVSSLPSTFKLKGGTAKYILKQAFKGMVPDNILNRSKMGFGVPLDAWFRGRLNGYLREHLLSERSIRRGYFKPDAVRNLIVSHENGRRNHGLKLWMLLVLELWHREFLDGQN